VPGSTHGDECTRACRRVEGSTSAWVNCAGCACGSRGAKGTGAGGNSRSRAGCGRECAYRKDVIGQRPLRGPVVHEGLQHGIAPDTAHVRWRGGKPCSTALVVFAGALSLPMAATDEEQNQCEHRKHQHTEYGAYDGADVGVTGFRGRRLWDGCA
jgi:hypothetical protein